MWKRKWLFYIYDRYLWRSLHIAYSASDSTGAC